MLPFLRNLRGKVAQDEIQNDFIIHGQISALFIASEAAIPEAFTAGIYAQVFQTPLHDPFLGLAPADVFTAIPPSIEVKSAAMDN